MRKYIYPTAMIILLLTLIFSIERCQFYNQNANANFKALTDSITYFTNRLGTQSASIKTLEIEKSLLNQNLLAKDKQLATLTQEFSEVKSIIRYSQTTKYDTITITYKDTISCIFSRFGKVKTKWYRFNYTTNNKGITIDSLTINNQATAITGFKRSWFLGKQTLTTTVTNTNPNITITSLTSAQVIVPNPWYKRWYVWLGAGVIGGMLTR
ncbi:DUF6549 family protein [Flavobacterium rivuli]|nr:DUF6549 family protein [Flavobacterium rivuli]